MDTLVSIGGHIMLLPIAAWFFSLVYRETYYILLFCRKEWSNSTFRVVGGMIVVVLLGVAYRLM